MPEKPSFASDYTKENVELVRQTCLYVATKLGDLMDDLVVVGGLVPSLLIPDESLPAGEDVHIGTIDLDLGLSLALLDTKRYEDLTLRLHRADFEPDKNEAGNPTFQRWKITPASDLKVTIDFMIPPSLEADKGGDLRHIENDFAAVITPGLRLAFQDRQKVSLEVRTLLGEKANREIWVCGPGAFVVLKILAFDQRGENKDAYDLYFVIRNYGNGVDDVCKCLGPLLKEAETQKVLEILNRDLFSQGYGKAQPHADFNNLQLRQPQFFRLSNNTGDATAPLFNQIQFTEDTGDDMVADFGNALTHIIDGHARQEDAGVFDFDTVIEKGDADGRSTLGIVGVNKGVDDRFAQDPEGILQTSLRRISEKSAPRMACFLRNSMMLSTACGR